MIRFVVRGLMVASLLLAVGCAAPTEEDGVVRVDAELQDVVVGGDEDDTSPAAGEPYDAASSPLSSIVEAYSRFGPQPDPWLGTGEGSGPQPDPWRPSPDPHGK